MTLRGVDWTVVLGGSAVGAAILAGCVGFAEDGAPLGHVRLALVPLAVAAGFVLDEPGAAAVDAVPRSRLRRTTARAVGILPPLCVWALAVLALELRGGPGTPALGLLVEGVSVLVVATGGAALLRAAGRAEPGEVVATVVGTAVVGALVFRLQVGSVPVFPVTHGWADSSTGWGLAAVVAAVLLLALSREPYRLRRGADHEGFPAS